LFFRMLFAKADTYSERYRHEYKYEISNPQIEILCCRLSQIMNTDRYAGESGVYEVRSLYFDDYANTCYYENENGIDPREKYRIRIYNSSDERIRLELKRKESGKTLKRSCDISRQQVESILVSGTFSWEDEMDALLKKFYVWLETRGGRPKVIVNYNRIPFVCPEGNTRITFDMNITASSDVNTFFDQTIYGRPIMPVGKHVLEVKFDSFLPDYIAHSVQINELKRITCSKYYLCRKFGGSI